jgi:hypothetical protein
MSNKKQAAVEWLVEQIDIKNPNWLKEEIEKAKEMEKQHIIDGYKNGIEEAIMRYSSEEYNLEYCETGEQY